MSKILKINTQTIQLDDKSMIDYYHQFLSEEDATNLFQELMKDIPWRVVERKRGNITFIIPRLQCWMSDPNVKTGLYQKESALQWSNSILKIKNLIERMLNDRGINIKFDYLLMSQYRDGNDYISPHYDDKAEEEGKNIIASLSLGITRLFQMKYYGSKWNKKNLLEYDFVSDNGSLIIMKGDTQLNWKHGVPKDPAITGPRINLTFRKS